MRTIRAGISTPSPAPRHRNHFANEPLPAPPSLNEADVSDKPAGVRNRVALTPARLRAIRENYQQRLESLLAVDEAIGQMMNQLAATGKLDNTYIIFTSDNGFMHGEHRIPQGKIVLYEPSVRVPLIIRGPGLPAGQHRSQFVANIDLAPTIVAGGGSAAGPRDGRPLAAPFAKDKLLQSGRDILLETPTYAGVRSPNWLYAEYTTGEKELYQLARDPYELNSQHINPAFDAMKTNLANRLARLRQCKGSVCRRGPQLGLSDAPPASRRSAQLPLDERALPGRRPVVAPDRDRRFLPRRAPAQARPPATVQRDRPQALREAGRLARGGRHHADRLAPADARAPNRRLRLLVLPRT